MKNLFIIFFTLFLTASCATTGKKVNRIQRNSISPTLSIPGRNRMPEMTVRTQQRDTFTVHDFEGREVLIMKAVRDVDGEMVATDEIVASVVTARFRNVAERHGKVDLEFLVTVPASMRDSKWQIRLYPDLFVLEDSLRLDPVVITGENYRKAQLKGYQQYRKFIESIIVDSMDMVNLKQLEIFLERNIPEIYRFRDDTTEVSDEVFASAYGVTRKQAVEHYTNKLVRWNNDRKISNAGKKYRKYVKVPIVSEGLRLDTVMRNTDGDFVYSYVQTISTRPKLRKAEVKLSGEIYEGDKQIYTVPSSENLTFYISSISSFVDERERFLTKIIERKAEANTACYIEFASASSSIDLKLGENAGEIGRITGNLKSLLENSEFDMDSIVITASSSPEGLYAYNLELSRNRACAVSDYFDAYVRRYRDSLNAVSIRINMDGENVEEEKDEIKFIARNNAENWDMLDVLVSRDSLLSDAQREEYAMLRRIPDPDGSELAMRSREWYPYVRGSLYPRLRTVKFDFHLHRKGMLKDTVHTTVPDTIYARGVQAVKDRDYELALSLLRPYNDFNTAVAYCAMDCNLSAKSILDRMEATAKVNYMLAIIQARLGNDESAVQHYMHSCSQDASFVHRGNLDPEISALIRRYGLNSEEQ